MKKFKIEIELENDVFNPDYTAEVKRILEVISDKLENGCTNLRILDINGNYCGYAEIVTEE